MSLIHKNRLSREAARAIWNQHGKAANVKTLHEWRFVNRDANGPWKAVEWWLRETGNQYAYVLMADDTVSRCYLTKRGLVAQKGVTIHAS